MRPAFSKNLYLEILKIGDMKNLVNKFNELKNEYHNSNTTNERKTELFQEMKECLILA